MRYDDDLFLIYLQRTITAPYPGAVLFDCLIRPFKPITILMDTTTSNHIRSITKVSGGGSFRSPYQFSIPSKEMEGLSPEDVMMSCGYHPAGYGTAFDRTDKDGTTTFKCSGSCD